MSYCKTMDRDIIIAVLMCLCRRCRKEQGGSTDGNRNASVGVVVAVIRMVLMMLVTMVVSVAILMICKRDRNTCCQANGGKR